MKENNTHEGCIEQINRLYRQHLYDGSKPVFDQLGRLRLDDLEMRPSVQEAAQSLWLQANTENLDEISDYAGYRRDFLKLFGFGLEGVDYEADIDPVVEFNA